MSPRVIDAVASNPSACPVFHIPFQSGDNEVLHNMRRGYTREKYLGIVANIRAAFPDGEVSVTGDVIVGFPGETEEQFRNTVALMEEVQFDACMTDASTAACLLRGEAGTLRLAHADRGNGSRRGLRD